MGFIEAELTARGPYICGEQFTAADIMISYPLLDLAPIIVPGYTAEAYPHIFAYTDRLRTRDAYKSSQEKVMSHMQCIADPRCTNFSTKKSRIDTWL